MMNSRPQSSMIVMTTLTRSDSATPQRLIAATSRIATMPISTIGGSSIPVRPVK
jgi:hypothetical protein